MPVAANPSPKQESFVYISRGFVGANIAVATSALIDCQSCMPSTYMFLHPATGRFDDSLQFSDVTNVGYVYYFPAGALQKAGEYTTVPRAGHNVGTLKVQVTEDLAVTNAAAYDFCSSFEGAACPAYSIAPDSIATVFGSDSVAPTTSIPQGAPLAPSLAGTSVTVLDSAGLSRAAQLYFVSPRQINFLVPRETALGPARVTITTPSGTRQIDTVVTSVHPGIFTANANGLGAPAAQLVRVRSDGSQAMENAFAWDTTALQWGPAPIAAGTDKVHLILYGTGIRNGADAVLHCWCGSTGMTNMPVAYAGPQGEFAGLDQINVQLPTFPSTDSSFFSYLFWLTVGGKDSNPFRLWFH